MKTKVRKITSVLLAVIIVIGVFFAMPITVSAMSQSEFDSKLNTLRSQYPDYSTWTSTFDGGSQCFGFARLIGYSVFGTYPSTWSKVYSISGVKAGDILQYGNTSGSGHTVFVTNVSGSTITFVDCNGNGNYSGGTKVRSCGIKWDNTISTSASMFGKYSFSYLLSSPGVTSGNNPTGCVDSITAGAGVVHVKGWAFDADDMAQYLQIHVYIGGPAGTSNVEGHAITANVTRIDVHNVYGCGYDHGFDTDIPTSKTGNQPIYIYAINIGSGENICIGSGTVNITTETNPPDISDITISQVSTKGYRITCRVTDDSGISKVIFPTWTSKNGQDDLIWYEANIYGDTATYFVSASDHNNEIENYVTHIYAYDNYDNCSFAAAPYVTLTDEPQVVSSTEYEGNLYVVYNAYMSWTEAKEWCESQGGHLAAITSEDEWNVVKSLLEDFNGIRCWLGAESTSGTWKWVTNEGFVFSNWYDGQPDCANSNEFYLGTYGLPEYIDCYYWNDYILSGEDRIGGFVCEFECVDLSDFNISLSSDSYTYDGKAKTPTVTVKNDTAVLTKDTDYTVEYSNNTNAGTATVTVTGIGNYTGTLTKTFTINKASQTLNAAIASSTINIGETSKITASGQGTITYSSGNTGVATVSSSGVVTGISAGTAAITVTAAGNSNYKSASKTITVSVQDSYVLGDINFDGSVNIDDVTLIQKYIADITELTGEQKNVADTNGDGYVMIDDATLMQKYLAGIITKLG